MTIRVLHTYTILLLHRYDDLVDCWGGRNCSLWKLNLLLHSFNTSTIIDIETWANTCGMQGNNKWYRQHCTSTDTSREVAKLLWVVVYYKRSLMRLCNKMGFHFSKTFPRKFKKVSCKFKRQFVIFSFIFPKILVADPRSSKLTTHQVHRTKLGFCLTHFSNLICYLQVSQTDWQNKYLFWNQQIKVHPLHP